MEKKGRKTTKKTTPVREEKKKGTISEKEEKKTARTKKEGSMTIPVLTREGELSEELKLPKGLAEVKINPRLVAQYVRVYLANQRQGTVSTKTRGEVRGSTRKIYRQKGTGRARHGDIKAPIFVGGGIAHGPKMRDFSLKINKKQKRKAFLMTFLEKIRQKGLLVIKDLDKIKPKTKDLVEVLDQLKLTAEKKILIVFTKEEGKNLALAGRNISNVILSTVDSLNSYLLLNSSKVLFSKSAFDLILKKYEN